LMGMVHTVVMPAERDWYNCSSKPAQAEKFMRHK
jgi:hypothetical protein